MPEPMVEIVYHETTGWPSRGTDDHVRWVGPEDVDATEEADFREFDPADPTTFDYWQPIAEWTVG